MATAAPRATAASSSRTAASKAATSSSLGTRYSEDMGADYSDDKQEKRVIVMGCYGIGVSRLVATSIEQNNDENGIKWPASIAPYQVHLVTIGQDAPVLETAKKLYDDLRAGGIDVPWGRSRRAAGREVQGRRPPSACRSASRSAQSARERQRRDEAAHRGRPQEGRADPGGGCGARPHGARPSGDPEVRAWRMPLGRAGAGYQARSRSRPRRAIPARERDPAKAAWAPSSPHVISSSATSSP